MATGDAPAASDPAGYGSVSQGADELTALKPLTERLLDTLPGRRSVIIGLWALVPWLNFGANLLLDTKGGVWDQNRALVVVNYAALSVGIVLTSWAAGSVARRVEGLLAKTAMICPGCTSRDFREMNSVRVPLVATVVAAAAFATTVAVDEGLDSGLIRGATWLIVGIPIWTFVWTYVALQRGLDRLGRERLRPAPLEPSLGLQPLGRIAFLGVWVLLVSLVPVVVTGLSDAVAVGLGLLVVAGGIAGFVLSQWRLHRQMVAFKADELAVAQALYAEAYEPVRAARTLAVLDAQRNLLSAADALEKRARAIHEWPVDEGTFARVVGIGTSVTGMIIARLILNPVGL